VWPGAGFFERWRCDRFATLATLTMKVFATDWQN
jgi:hypothetical protein